MGIEKIYDLGMELYEVLGELKCLKHGDLVKQRGFLGKRLYVLGNELGKTVELPRNQQSFFHYAKLGD